MQSVLFHGVPKRGPHLSVRESQRGSHSSAIIACASFFACAAWRRPRPRIRRRPQTAPPGRGLPVADRPTKPSLASAAKADVSMSSPFGLVSGEACLSGFGAPAPQLPAGGRRVLLWHGAFCRRRGRLGRADADRGQRSSRPATARLVLRGHCGGLAGLQQRVPAGREQRLRPNLRTSAAGLVGHRNAELGAFHRRRRMRLHLEAIDVAFLRSYTLEPDRGMWWSTSAAVRRRDADRRVR